LCLVLGRRMTHGQLTSKQATTTNNEEQRTNNKEQRTFS